MSTLNLDIDTLFSGPNAVTIIAPNTSNSTAQSVTIKGIMTNDLTIGATADYGPLYDTSITDQLDLLIRQAVGVAGSLGFLSGLIQKITSTPKNVLQTAMVWKNTKQPIFQLDLLLLKIHESDSISSQVQALYSMVMPANSVVPGAADLNFSTGFVSPPLGYFPTLDPGTVAAGTISMQLGNWFAAHGLIATSVAFTFSKEIATDGFPLFASGTVLLQPYRMITFSEFQQYFRK